MTPRRRLLLALLLGAWALSTGCAGVLDFHTPAPFKDRKLKEDPPEGWLAPGPGGARPC